MSRGFVKEDDQEETPIIPPRAALPKGVTNYVTPTGLKLLQAERKQLESERKNLAVTEEQQRRRDLAIINGKLGLLQERIVLARVLQPKDQPKDEVRFGATVTFKMNNKTQVFTIVGVDEADIKQQKIAFVAPIAKAITGAKVGKEVAFTSGTELRKLEVLDISYK